MKKYLGIIIALTFTVNTVAQHRKVTLPEKPNKSEYRNYSSEDKGFWCAFDFDGGTSIMDNRKNMQFVNLTFTGGYRISEFLRLGAGFGGRYYVNNAEVRNTSCNFGVPIFANARGNFVSAYDRDGVPFWSVNIGGITQDGFFFSPTFGYSFGGMRNNFMIGLCYTLTSFEDYTSKNQNYSSLSLKLGYEF